MSIPKVCLTFDFGMTFAIKMRQTIVGEQSYKQQNQTLDLLNSYLNFKRFLFF